MLREGLFDKVYESLYPILFRIAYRITGNRTKAEDLCHEAFIKYLQTPKAQELFKAQGFTYLAATN